MEDIDDEEKSKKTSGGIMAVDTKIAVLLLCIGVALTLISYFETQIPPTSEDITTVQKSQSTTEESTRYDSFYALLTDKQKKQFVAIYAEKNENVQISIQVQNFDKDRDANDIEARFCSLGPAPYHCTSKLLP
ncbi:MAG: hypothetical protein QXW37_07295 [Candidatus Nitrosotenuis sp.]